MKSVLDTSIEGGGIRVRYTRKRIFAIDHCAKYVSIFVSSRGRTGRAVHLIVDSQADPFLEASGRVSSPSGDVPSDLQPQRDVKVCVAKEKSEIIDCFGLQSIGI